MLNIMLIIMLFNSIYNFIFKRNVVTNLNCGIFAWTGVSSDKFSPFIFNVLGVYNDNRGGDSCGVYFNKNSITGIKTESKYESLVKSQKLHTTVKPGKWPVVIGHCRKASVGAVSEINVQPVLVRNASKDNKLMYVQAHNGTISNHKELATKYKVNTTTDESDSVIIAKLIEKEGFKILSEYEGSAALVMYFVKQPNVLYAFRGTYKQYGANLDERPLHYIQIPGSGTYISSESSPLEFVANGAKAESFKTNMIYKLEGDKIEEFQEVKREKAVVKKYDPPVVQRSFNYYDSDYYGGNEYYDEMGNWRKGGALSVTKKDEEIETEGVTNNICTSTVEICKYSNDSNSRITYFRGFYWKGSVYAHGRMDVDNWGYCRESNHVPINAIKSYTLYFFYGVLLINKEAYDSLITLANGNGVTSAAILYKNEVYNKMSHAIGIRAVSPFTRLSQGPSTGYMEPAFVVENDRNYKSTFYHGAFAPLFTDCELHFANGDLKGYKRRTSKYNIAELLAEYPGLEDLEFGKEEKAKPVVTEFPVKSCADCMERGIWNKGDKCMTCESDFIDTYKEEDKEMVVTLNNTIGLQLAPILDDLDSLIAEIETSGYEHLIPDSLEILNEANEKLKEIKI